MCLLTCSVFCVVLCSAKCYVKVVGFTQFGKTPGKRGVSGKCSANL